MRTAVVIGLAAVAGACGVDTPDVATSPAPLESNESTAASTTETTPVTTALTVPVVSDPPVDPATPVTPVTVESVPDDVAVELADQRFGFVFGICEDVYQNPPPEPVDFCLFPIDDATYGPNAFGTATGYNPAGFVVIYARTEEGWTIDQEIDTTLIFPDCDVPAPPPDAVVVTTDQGIDIDFNKGDDRVVQWTTADTTYLQAYGETTLKSEPYELPAGYRVAGSGDADGQSTDEYIILTNDTGETIAVWVEGCGWATSLE